MSFSRSLLPALLAFVLMVISVRAEPQTIRAAQQFGLSYLPLMIMEDRKLVEKHAEAAGLSGLTTTWVKIGGPAQMSDALLAGEIDFGAGGMPSLLTLWAKTRNTPLAVRGVAAMGNMPLDLVTTNPAVKSLKDFTPQDKIAVTSVKSATQALLLQMAAAREWGIENYERLDPLTVAMPHPDAVKALLSGTGAISAHFSAPPYQYHELKQPGVHFTLSSYDILGGPATFNLVWGSSKFRQENPKAYRAFFDAMSEAMLIINANKLGAVQAYKRITGTEETIDELLAILDDPLVEMTLTPSGTMRVADFMKSVGRLPEVPGDWSDLFFPELHQRPGS